MNDMLVDFRGNLISVGEIRNARMEPAGEPGFPARADAPEVLVIHWKRTGHLTIENATYEEFMRTLLDASVRGLPL